MQQNNRVLSFLIRLDKKFGQVRSNMLMMAELPTSAQAYRILLQEKTHLDISSIETNDSMVYRVNKRKFQENGSAKNNSEYGKAKKQNFFFCDHSKIGGHTNDRCWKIIGYPANFKGNTWKRGSEKPGANLAHDTAIEEGLVTPKFTST